MWVVLGANIYVSALISSRGHPHKIVQAWLEGAFDVLISQPIVDEQLRVTGYERLQKKYRRVKENRPEFVALVAQQGVWVEPGRTLEIVQEGESDNRHLECAVEGGGQYVVSGDNHLLAVGEYRGIRIVPPATFVTLLATGHL